MRCGAANVAAIGYGKLGALELGYASDLDLVFLHDSTGDVQRTNGSRALDNGAFFLRLGQRIMHLLTLHSAAGRLYEVDMRLRPSGKGGLMVTQIDAFHEYQKSEAWTWEHQALLRARAVAGADALRRRFEDIRVDVLCHHVRRDSLREEVRKMRERMRAELSKARAATIRCQAGSRRHRRHRIPGAVLGTQVGGSLPAADHVLGHDPTTGIGRLRQPGRAGDGGLLTGIYRAYRATLHHRSLENLPPVVDERRICRGARTGDCDLEGGDVGGVIRYTSPPDIASGIEDSQSGRH